MKDFLQADDDLIRTPLTPGGVTTHPGNWERQIDHLEEMLQSVLITIADAREQGRVRSVRRSKTKKATRDGASRRKKKQDHHLRKVTLMTMQVTTEALNPNMGRRARKR
jgi:hypothetical protein